ncbi:dienelactone hydrolase [Pseudomonas marginalis]|uniref:dienelactone hydrolase family protein n=1 Tax=Pseudomonas marginalis TaxID=298 RepID=UPI00209F0970|nr:dienelactone hydrolase family protein [Pseudomonas marginalis]MCP1507573.1 dienelactone hydrolase [Pseudomonas marginalis]MCP1525077.1 dienelactone hydrolase [Pseudomonas marginalis]MDQ0500328.1 dienelactone hydrolase [Pseudomonas marginalis]
MSTTPLRYSADDLSFCGQLACPDVQGKVPGILIFPEAPGVGPHVIRRAGALARMNYVALAADVHGEGVLFDDPTTMRANIDQLKSQPERLIQRLQASLQALAQVPQVDPQRMLVIGYCFGGWCALELARTGAPLLGVGVFHGALIPTQANTANRIQGKVLVCSGASDPLVPTEQITAFTQEMSAAGVDWQVHLYGGTGHGFTSPEAGSNPRPGFGYSAASDHRSWAALGVFLNETFDMGKD